MDLKQNTDRGKAVNCSCGKLLAVERNGRIYVYCKRCKREFPVARLEPRAEEPRANDAK